MDRHDFDHDAPEDYIPPTNREVRAMDQSWFIAPPYAWRHPVTARHGWQPQTDLLTFGQYVKRARYLAGMSQDEAEKASGVDQGSISRLERGLAPAMKVERIVKLASGIGSAFPLGFCPHQHWCPWQPASPARHFEPQAEDPEETREALRILYGLARADDEDD